MTLEEACELLEQLRSDLAEMRDDTSRRIGELRSEAAREIETLRDRVRCAESEAREARREVDQVKWNSKLGRPL